MSVEGLESQIAEWRTYVASAPAVNGHDVDELEDHLRHQIAELNTAGLAEDEAFLVAVKRLGDMDAVSREFAREHSDRLWKQLLGPGEEASPAPSGWVEALVFAVGAAVAIEVARLVAGFPDEEPTWFARNLGLFVLPSLAAYFARRRQLDLRGWVVTAVPFVVAALVVNLYPFDADSDTEKLVAAFSGLELMSPFGKIRYRPQDHQSTMGAYVGVTRNEGGKGVMVDYSYKDGGKFQPSDDEIRALRKAP